MHPVCAPSKSALGYRNKTFPNYTTQYRQPPHTHTQEILTKIYHFTMVSNQTIDDDRRPNLLWFPVMDHIPNSVMEQYPFFSVGLGSTNPKLY